MKKLLLLLLCPLSMFAQLPQKIDTDNQVIEHNGFTISYNETCEQPNWVYYTLKPSDLEGDKVSRPNNFREDEKVLTGSAELSDYKYSGYHRGHLKPAGDEPTNKEQISETFLMSNMSPQIPSFNMGVWKRLENYVRKLMVNNDSVIVITGGHIYKGLETIGDNEVCIPEHFYKVLYIYKDGVKTTECYLIPNEKSNVELSEFLVPLADLESAIGLKF